MRCHSVACGTASQAKRDQHCNRLRQVLQPDLPVSLRKLYGTHMFPMKTHVDDEAGNVIETHEHAGDFKEW